MSKSNWTEAATPGLALKRAIARYHSRDQDAIRGFALANKAQADLIATFPAAALAITRRRGAAKARLEGLRCIALGSPLPIVARALDLPAWMRRLPPEGLHHELPANLRHDRADYEFDVAIAKVMPKTFAEGCNWLDAVMAAREACNDEFALWLCGKPVLTKQFVDTGVATLLGAYAWFSLYAPSWCAGARAPLWTKRSSFRAAAAGAFAWWSYACIACSRLAADGCTAWYATRRICGYDFVPLRSREDLRREGATMDNCLGGYWARVALGVSHIFSIRQDGTAVADMEVVVLDGFAHIEQLVGPSNQRAPDAIRQAAQAWLIQLAGVQGSPLADCQSLVLDATAWRLICSPWATTRERAAALEHLSAADAAPIMSQLRNLASI